MLSPKTQQEVSECVREKMTSNFADMKIRIEPMRDALRKFEQAVNDRSLDGMHHSLADLSNTSLNCRARLQYMRGIWAVLRNVRDKDPIDE